MKIEATLAERQTLRSALRAFDETVLAALTRRRQDPDYIEALRQERRNIAAALDAIKEA